MAEEHCKPGSVSVVGCPPAAGNHSSRTAVAGGLKRPDPKALDGPSSNAFLFGLAPDGVYRACGVAAAAGGLLPHHFTLTSFVREKPFFPQKGGILSVALSLGSPPVPVRNHPALWSPDFPPALPRNPGRSRRFPVVLRPCRCFVAFITKVQDFFAGSGASR